jgi:predicted RNase H-like HicB family nuclease
MKVRDVIRLIEYDGSLVKRVQYLVRLDKEPDSDWGASVPDLPGCVATRKTIGAALRRIERAICLHLEGIRADGRTPPRPRQRAIRPRSSARGLSFYATVPVAA